MSDESLGKFVIDLEARVDKLESDLGRAGRLAERAAKQMQKSFEDGFKRMEEAARRGTEGMMEAVTALTGFSPAQLGIGAIVAGFGELTKKAIETGDQFNKMAQRTGIAVSGLQGLVYAGDLADVSMDTLGTSLGKFAKTVSSAANGSKDQAAAFSALGISVRGADGAIRPMDALVADVADKFSSYRDGVEKTAAAQVLFGKSGATLIPLLNGGGAALRTAAAEAKALGYNFEDIAGQSEEFNDNLTRMGKAAIGFGADIARELLPSLIAGEQKILDLIKAARENGALQSLAAAIATVATNLDAAAVVLATRFTLTSAVSGIASVQKALRAAGEGASLLGLGVQALGGPFGIATAAIAALAGAIYLYTTREDENEKAIRATTDAIEKLRAARDGERAELAASSVAIARDTAERLKHAEAVLAELEAKNLSLQSANAGLNASMGGENNFSDNPLGMAMSKQRKEVDALRESLTGLRREMSINDAVEDMFGETVKGVTPNIAALGAKQDEARKAAEALQEMLLKDGQALAKMRGELDPVAKLQEKYVGAIIEAQGAYAKETDTAKKASASQQQYAQIKDIVIAKTKAAQDALKAETADYIKQHDVVQDYLDKVKDELGTVGLSDRQKEAAEAVNRLTEAWRKNDAAVREWLAKMGVVDPTTEAGRLAIERAATTLYDSKQAFKASEDAARDWTDIWRRGADDVARSLGDFASGSLRKFSDFGNAIADVARQIVGSIVETFAKLNIINPILNGIFGGTTGFSLLPTAASAATSFGAPGSAAEGSGGSLFNTASWVSAGQKLWTGFTGGFSTFLNGTGGSFNWSMLSSRGYEAANLNNLNMASVYGAPGSNALGYGGYGSPWAQGLGIAAGVYAGYGRFQNRYNTMSGLAGGAAYGLGTYAAGAGLASAAGGAGFMAGASVLGPIGWAAMIAMGIDMLSGGKLFGTKGKLQGGSTTISIGDTGADIGGNLSFKGQKPLFGGTKWTNQSFDPGSEAHAAVDALYGKLRKEADAFANYFLTKGVVAAGSFWAEFDKKGKPTGKTTTTIGGYTFQDETQEQFIAREMAFSRIEILKAAGVSVTAYTDQFVKDADAFSQAVEDAAMAMQLAQQDIRKNALDISGGKGLQGAFDLANKWLDGADSLTETYQRLSAELTDVRNAAGLLTGQTTIEGIETFLRETRNVGETLTQTYQRLIQAAQQYRQFVGQFTPQVTYVDDFEASLAAVRAQLEANIKTANDLAKAAGLQGASAKDLANIYAASAKQAADLAKQLDIAMQSRAFALGVTTQGSLSDVQAEIQRLTGLRDAAQPVRDFGNAMQEAAQRATDAIGLLIGDRSPLKDRQKLAIARQGLMAGTVTQDQFLAIAERLFSKSTTAYDREFAFAQQFGGRGGSGAGGGSTPSGSGAKPFSAADQKRLDELNKLLPQLEAANRLQEFRSLAQQIAEMSQFTGDSWKKIVQDRGYDLQAIEKGLGIKSDAEFAAFIDKLQKQQDSDGQNTSSIVAVLLKILGELQRQAGAREGGPQLPTGRGDNDRTLKQIGDAVGRSVGDALDRSGWRNRRAPEFPR